MWSFSKEIPLYKERLTSTDQVSAAAHVGFSLPKDPGGDTCPSGPLLEEPGVRTCPSGPLPSGGPWRLTCAPRSAQGARRSRSTALSGRAPGSRPGLKCQTPGAERGRRSAGRHGRLPAPKGTLRGRRARPARFLTDVHPLAARRPTRNNTRPGRGGTAPSAHAREPRGPAPGARSRRPPVPEGPAAGFQGDASGSGGRGVGAAAGAAEQVTGAPPPPPPAARGPGPAPAPAGSSSQASWAFLCRPATQPWPLPSSGPLSWGHGSR